MRADSAGEAQGATFVVELPLVRERIEQTDGERPPRLDADGGAGLGFANLAGLHILTVDDEPDARELLAAILQRAGADVAVSASAAEALRLCHLRKADVIVSDIGMPEEDGYAFIQKVRTLKLQSGVVPAVALTANARSEDRSRALAAGFQMHLAKPIDPAEFTKAIAELIAETR